MGTRDRTILVSVVFLTKNGGYLLEEALQAISNQELPPNLQYEILAVDSGSEDSTVEILNQYGVKTCSIQPLEFNFGKTRDLAFGLARGEILISLSQDAVPSNSHWLTNLITPLFADRQIALVQGLEFPRSDCNFYWSRLGLFYFTRETRQWINSYGTGVSFVGCAIRRSAWENCKLGLVEMSEDKVFQKKLIDIGYKIVAVEDAVYYHSHDYTLKSLVLRCKNEGLGWKHVGVNYSIRDMLLDLFNIHIHTELVKALLNKQIHSMQELFFPIIRPIFIFLGNHYSKKYTR